MRKHAFDGSLNVPARASFRFHLFGISRIYSPVAGAGVGIGVLRGMGVPLIVFFKFNVSKFLGCLVSWCLGFSVSWCLVFLVS